MNQETKNTDTSTRVDQSGIEHEKVVFDKANKFKLRASDWPNLQFQRRKPTDMLVDGTAVPDWAKGHGSWKGWVISHGDMRWDLSCESYLSVTIEKTTHMLHLYGLNGSGPTRLPMPSLAAADAIIAGLEAKP
ncbi:hypothetical protein EBT16_00985 [bacterium]|nr:hypothetical protein [bacterium]